MVFGRVEQFTSLEVLFFDSCFQPLRSIIKPDSQDNLKSEGPNDIKLHLQSDRFNKKRLDLEADSGKVASVLTEQTCPLTDAATSMHEKRVDQGILSDRTWEHLLQEHPVFDATISKAEEDFVYREREHLQNQMRTFQDAEDKANANKTENNEFQEEHLLEEHPNFHTVRNQHPIWQPDESAVQNRITATIHSLWVDFFLFV